MKKGCLNSVELYGCQVFVVLPQALGFSQVLAVYSLILTDSVCLSIDLYWDSFKLVGHI